MKLKVLVIAMFLTYSSTLEGCIRYRSFVIDDPMFTRTSNDEYDYQTAVDGVGLSLSCGVLNERTIKLRVRLTNNTQDTLTYIPSVLSITDGSKGLVLASVYVNDKRVVAKAKVRVPNGSSRIVIWRYFWPHRDQLLKHSITVSLGSAQPTKVDAVDIDLGEITMVLLED